MGKIQKNWGLIKNKLGINFHSSPVHDKKIHKNYSKRI